MNTPLTRHDEIESALRTELRARTAPLASSEPPFARIESATRRDRTRRRTAAGGGLALVTTLVAVTPLTVHALSDHTVAVAGGRGSTSTSSSSSSSSSSSKDKIAAAEAAAPLFQDPLRGNLAHDSSFIQAVDQKDYPHSKLMYADDDGTHTIVIGGTVALDPHGIPAYAFTVLIGPPNAQVNQLKRGEGFAGYETTLPPANLTYVDPIDAQNTTDAPLYYAVLGPTGMTSAEYATSAELQVSGDKLVLKRTGVGQIPLTDGAGAGEITGTNTLAAAMRLSQLLAFHGTTKSGAPVSLQPMTEVVNTPLTAGDIFSPAYDPIRDQVVAVARQNGVTVASQGPGGDAVADNTAQVLADLATFAGVDPSAVNVQVKWVGRETENWDSALVEFDVPGLPEIQAFIRGLAPGRPDSASPGLAVTYVRPATQLIPGQYPETAAAFGGTSEASTFGFGLRYGWVPID